MKKNSKTEDFGLCLILTSIVTATVGYYFMKNVKVAIVLCKLAPFCAVIGCGIIGGEKLRNIVSNRKDKK